MNPQLAQHIQAVYERTKDRNPFERSHTLRMEKLLRYYTNNQFVDTRDIATHLRLIYRQKRINRLNTAQFLNLQYLYAQRMIQEFKQKIPTPQPVKIKLLARRVRTG